MELVYFFCCSCAGVVPGCPLLASENPVPAGVKNCMRAVEAMIHARMMDTFSNDVDLFT